MRKDLFGDWCYKVLPLIYNDSISYYEILCKVGEYIKDLIEAGLNRDEAIEQLQKELEELKNNIDEVVIDTINGLIEKWKDDGTLENYIKQYTGRNENSSLLSLNQLLPSESSEWTEEGLENSTASYFYNLYNELVQQFSNNFSAVTWGYDEANVPLIYYKWTPDFVNTYSGGYIYQQTNTKRCIFITSGVHGEEKESIISVYRVIKEWLNGNNGGEYIKNNFVLYILPCVNGYGITNNLRNNANNVNINRNFPDGFTPSDTHGEAPLSEQSSKFVSEVLNTAIEECGSQSVMFIDSHNFQKYRSDPPQTCVYYNAGYNGPYKELPVVAYNTAYHIKNEIVKLYPELDSNKFVKFLSIATEGTTTDYADSLGCSSLLIEGPINFTKEVAFNNQSAVIGFINLSNMIFNVCGNNNEINVNKRYYRLEQIGCDANSTLLEIFNALPKGSSIELSISTSSPMINLMPTPYKCILKIYKTYNDANCGYGLCTANGGFSTNLYTKAFRGTEEGKWNNLLKPDTNNSIPSESLQSLNGIFNYLKPGEWANIRVISTMPLASDMPEDHGNLLMWVPEVPSDYAKTAFILFLGDSNKEYTKLIFGSTVTYWGYTQKTWTNETIGDNANTIENLIDFMSKGEEAILRINNAGIASELPESYGILHVSIPLSNDNKAVKLLFNSNNGNAYINYWYNGELKGWRMLNNWDNLNLPTSAIESLTSLYNFLKKGESAILRVYSDMPISSSMPENNGNLKIEVTNSNGTVAKTGTAIFVSDNGVMYYSFIFTTPGPWHKIAEAS